MILQITCCISEKSGLPMECWDDGVLTTTYAVNCLPTPILQNISHIKVLHKKPPNYKVMKNFGCCFPLILPTVLNCLPGLANVYFLAIAQTKKDIVAEM